MGSGRCWATAREGPGRGEGRGTSAGGGLSHPRVDEVTTFSESCVLTRFLYFGRGALHVPFSDWVSTRRLPFVVVRPSCRARPASHVAHVRTPLPSRPLLGSLRTPVPRPRPESHPDRLSSYLTGSDESAREVGPDRGPPEGRTETLPGPGSLTGPVVRHSVRVRSLPLRSGRFL